MQDVAGHREHEEEVKELAQYGVLEYQFRGLNLFYPMPEPHSHLQSFTLHLHKTQGTLIGETVLQNSSIVFPASFLIIARSTSNSAGG
jgi:hypothetical protein